MNYINYEKSHNEMSPMKKVTMKQGFPNLAEFKIRITKILKIEFSFIKLYKQYFYINYL